MASGLQLSEPLGEWMSINAAVHRVKRIIVGQLKKRTLIPTL